MQKKRKKIGCLTIRKDFKSWVRLNSKKVVKYHRLKRKMRKNLQKQKIFKNNSKVNKIYLIFYLKLGKLLNKFWLLISWGKKMRRNWRNLKTKFKNWREELLSCRKKLNILKKSSNCNKETSKMRNLATKWKGINWKATWWRQKQNYQMF